MGRRSKQLIKKERSSQLFEELKKVILGLWAIIKDLFHYIKTLDFQGLRKEWNKIRNLIQNKKEKALVELRSFLFSYILFRTSSYSV